MRPFDSLTIYTVSVQLPGSPPGHMTAHYAAEVQLADRSTIHLDHQEVSRLLGCFSQDLKDTVRAKLASLQMSII